MEIVVLLLIGIVSRILPHAPNMTAIGGLSLFSGARLPFKKSLAVVFGSMLVSDLVLGFHHTMWATYGSLLLAILIGRFIKDKGMGWVIGGTLASSLVFFLITNFAVWMLPYSVYPKTVVGLMECYIMAIPFFRNSLIGDLFYTGLFFAAIEFVKQKQLLPIRPPTSGK